MIQPQRGRFAPAAFFCSLQRVRRTRAVLEYPAATQTGVTSGGPRVPGELGEATAEGTALGRRRRARAGRGGRRRYASVVPRPSSRPCLRSRVVSSVVCLVNAARPPLRQVRAAPHHCRGVLAAVGHRSSRGRARAGHARCLPKGNLPLLPSPLCVPRFFLQGLHGNGDSLPSRTLTWLRSIISIPPTKPGLIAGPPLRGSPLAKIALSNAIAPVRRLPFKISFFPLSGGPFRKRIIKYAKPRSARSLNKENMGYIRQNASHHGGAPNKPLSTRKPL